MKFRLIFIIFLFSTILLSCADKSSRASNSFEGVAGAGTDVGSIIGRSLQSGVAPTTDGLGNSTARNPKPKDNTPSPMDYKGKKIDVDLTTIHPMLIYGEVYNMVVNPQSYIGKVVKIEGQYRSYTDTQTGKNYFFVSVEEAVACCAQGIEFVFDEDKVFPNDYPPEDSFVELVGEFDIYDIDGYLFFYLRTDMVKVIG